MDALQSGIVILLRSALTGENLPLPEGFDLEAAYDLMKRHQIITASYVGAINCGLDRELPAMQKLFRGYCTLLLRSEQQDHLARQITEAFDAAGVDYMPLKGSKLRALYPSAELRMMGDVDILIRLEQYDKIREIMQEQEYTEVLESSHELIWRKNVLVVELHKWLIPPKHAADYAGHFNACWQLAKPVSGTRYAMSAEDEFVYLVAHFSKHYRDGGIGCRHVADLWLYRKAHPEINWKYVEDLLREIRLLEFYRNICRVLAVWFEGEQTDEKVDFISRVIFESGAWGKRENTVLAATARSQKRGGGLLRTKLRRLRGLTFLPLWQMRQKYPVLKKWPVLLPAFWVVRAVKILVFTKGKLAQHSREFAYATKERVNEYQASLDYVGLDFYVEE